MIELAEFNQMAIIHLNAKMEMIELAEMRKKGSADSHARAHLTAVLHRATSGPASSTPSLVAMCVCLSVAYLIPLVACVRTLKLSASSEADPRAWRRRVPHGGDEEDASGFARRRPAAWHAFHLTLTENVSEDITRHNSASMREHN